MNTQSILLIHPASPWGEGGESRVSVGMPLSLLYLSGAIRKTCTEITIFDAYLEGNDDAKLNQILNDAQPFIVGMNCLFSGNFPEVRRLASNIKGRFPEIKIILGGIHPTMYYQEIMLHCPDIDAICLGESDYSFPSLVQYFQQDALDDTVLPDALHGVVVRTKYQIIIRERRNYIENIDALPMPGYEYFDFNRYRVNTSTIYNPRGIQISEVVMPVLSSRSCPNQCYFCAMRLVMGNRFRMRSAQGFFDEIKHLYDNYGVNYFNIADDNFSFNRQRTLDICNLIIKSGMKIYLSFWAGLMVRTLDQELIDTMCEAGGVRFNLAIESGSDFIRNKIVRKNCSKEMIVNAVSALKKHDVLANAFFMIGFPEDTEESLQESIDLINELSILDSIVLSKVNPLPGTALFAQCVRDKLFLENIDESQLWKGEHTLARSMIDGGGLGRFLIKPYKMTMEKLVEYDDRITQMIKKKMAKAAAGQMRNKLAANRAIIASTEKDAPCSSTL